MKAVVVAGLQSGTGKTTVAVGLMGALRRLGLTVQPFKVGPDYIDPSYHSAACDRPCRNLDRWMLSLDALQTLFRRAGDPPGRGYSLSQEPTPTRLSTTAHSPRPEAPRADTSELGYPRASATRRHPADIAVIEGVMGLFDGRTGEGDRASTAEVARALGAPVLLVLDVSRIARTAAALVSGVRAFDPQLALAGVVLNRVASERHAAAIAPEIEALGVPVLGVIGRDAALQLPERYLGLVPVTEGTAARTFLDHAATTIAAAIDLPRLLRLLPPLPSVVSPLRDDDPEALFPTAMLPTRARIAIARDRAFHFYYEDNLDLLEAWGAELLPFSPLEDESLPTGAQGVYLGGGFPELFARELAANRPMHAALHQAAAHRLPIYAECGGYMYLGQWLTDRDGTSHAMVGLAPICSTMDRARLTLGYRTATAVRPSFLLQPGEAVRGHEFHWSVESASPSMEAAAYRLDGAEGPVGHPRLEGYASGSLLASYVHLHFGADRRLAARFVNACAPPPFGRFPPAWPAPEGISASARTHAPAGIAARGGEHGPDDRPEAGNPPSSLSVSAAVGERAVGEKRPKGGGPATGSAPPRPSGTSAGPLLRRYGLPGDEIERRSLASIDTVLAGMQWGEADRAVARRLIYSVGDPAIAPLLRLQPTAVSAGIAAIRAGRPIYCDVKMVASGINRRLADRFGCAIRTAIDDPAIGELSQKIGYPRAAAAMLSLGPELDRAVVAIGNAPTALLALLDLCDAGVARPAVIAGLPVGFVAATEAKEALLARELPAITIIGTRGGTPLAVAAVNALLLLASKEQA